MKKNGGFVATSLLYSFFLVFIAILMAILQNYIVSNNIMKRYNETISNRVTDRKSNLVEIIIARSNQDIVDNSGNTVTTNYDSGNKKEVFKFGNDYRYIGEDPNNYVCFTKECSSKWRIIGIFDGRAKIISTTTLTGNFTQNVKPTDVSVTSKIESYTYKLGVTTTYQNQNADYFKGIENSGTDMEISGEGMYLSDYMYTYALNVNPQCYKDISQCQIDNTKGLRSSYLASSNNEWLLLKYDASNAYYKTSSNTVATAAVTTSYSKRTTVYLKSDTIIYGGNGSQDDPYTLSL